MLALLIVTHTLIPVAKHPERYGSWPLWPIRNASVLGAILGALVVIGAYLALSRRFRSLRKHGAVVLFAAILSGISCAFIVFASERSGGVHDFTNLLSTAGQITAAIFVAFVIEQRYAPREGGVTDLDVIGFAFIVTSMGVAIVGTYPVGSEWQAALGAEACMGAGGRDRNVGLSRFRALSLWL